MNESVTIITSLIIFLFPYIGKLWFNRSTLANTVVTLGVLGTFSGIFLGLMHFDVNHIEAALPPLLEGLKTAFLTSIAGMCSSLILKLFPAFYGVKAEEQADEKEETKILLDTLSAIEKNTASSTQTLTTELNLLNDSFKMFAQHMSQLNAEAMTTALQTVMEQWDSKITEQMNVTLEEIKTAVQSLEKAETSNTEQIKIISENIQKAVDALQQSSGNLGMYLNKSISLSNKQHETITGQMSQLGNMVKTTEEHWEKQMQEMEERFTRELTAMEQFTRTLVTIIKKLTQDHNAITKRQQEED